MRRSLHIALALALTLCAATAVSAASTGPLGQPTNNSNPVAVHSADTTSPGDPFTPQRPDRGGPTIKQGPFFLDCFVNEKGQMVVVNTTGLLLQPGAEVVVLIPPDEELPIHIQNGPFEPGEQLAFNYPPAASPGFTCTAKLVEKEKYYVDPSNVPTPWYLKGEVSFSCGLKYNGEYFVGLYNTSDVMIPAGTKLVFQLPNGQWMTYVLEKDWWPMSKLKLPIPYSDQISDLFHDDVVDCKFTKVETGYNGPKIEQRGLQKIDPDNL